MKRSMSSWNSWKRCPNSPKVYLEIVQMKERSRLFKEADEQMDEGEECRALSVGHLLPLQYSKAGSMQVKATHNQRSRAILVDHPFPLQF